MEKLVIIRGLFITFLVLISIWDIRRRIVPDEYIILIFILGVIKNWDINSIYAGMAMFSLPFFLIWLFEQYLDKELIGLGDIKLMLVIGGYKGGEELLYIYIFYFLIYTISFMYILLFRSRGEYIAFAPFICIVSILSEFVRFYA